MAYNYDPLWDAENWNEEDIEELDLDALEDIAGGRIKTGGYTILTATIKQYQELGRDKEYCMQAIRKGWEEDCKFKKVFTDGKDEDLDLALAYIDRFYDKI